MNRTHGLLALLLVLSGVWAFFIVHPVGGTTSDEKKGVPVWDIPRDSVQRLEYQKGDLHVSITPDWSGGGDLPFVWVETKTPKAKPPKKDPKPDATKAPKAKDDAAKDETATAEEPPVELTEKAFKGNKSALESLEAFARPDARRDLGAYDKSTGASYGFPGEEHAVTLTREDGTLILKFGRQTFGKGGQYALSSRDDHLFLMALTQISRLDRAESSMLDRDLTAITQKEIARIDASTGILAQSFHKLQEGDGWYAGERKEAEIPGLPKLVSTLNSIKAVGYVTAEKNEELEGKSPELRFLLYKQGSQVADDEILLVTQGAGVFAKSRYTRKWVTLSSTLGKQLMEQGGKILGGT